MDFKGLVKSFYAFGCFPLVRVVMYTVFMVFSLPKALVKNLANNLVKNLAKNLGRTFSSASGTSNSPDAAGDDSSGMLSQPHVPASFGLACLNLPVNGYDG